jgi:predicted Fe-Mo cluster-binding NifX family protein
MERVAIPLFQDRISPVLDSCRRVMVVDIDNGQIIKRTAIVMDKMSLTERVEAFSRWKVDKIVCAGVSDLMCKYLSGKKIVLKNGIAGQFEEIIQAYICNRLDDECFLMPGKKGFVNHFK